MHKTRIEVNELGEFFIIIPDDVIAEYEFEEGDAIELDTQDDEFVILSSI